LPLDHGAACLKAPDRLRWTGIKETDESLSPGTTHDGWVASRRTKRGNRALMAMVAIVTTILTVAGLGIAQPVFAPLSFALFVLAIVWPLQARLQAWMPKLLALALTC
jgi:hypothetical protein